MGFALAVSALPARAAVWPAGLQEYARQGEPQPLDISTPVMAEYGAVAGESARYAAGSRTFSVSAWQFKDATGAVAAALSLEGSVARGNSVIRVDDGKVSRSELDRFFNDLPGFREPPRPTLPSYLTPKAVAGSARYILGEESRKAFLPDLTPSQLGLDLGSEAEVAQVRVGGQPARIVIVRFPTPQIARLKVAEWAALPNTSVKRSGPLVAALLPDNPAPLDAKAAEALLAPFEFRAVLIENEANPNQPVKDAANMMLSIFTLAGVLLVICLGGGLIFGLLRLSARRSGSAYSEEIQVLGLRD